MIVRDRGTWRSTKQRNPTVLCFTYRELDMDRRTPHERLIYSSHLADAECSIFMSLITSEFVIQ